jgi:Ca2+-transporting ATPase
MHRVANLQFSSALGAPILVAYPAKEEATMPWHSTEAHDAVAELKSDAARGLSSIEAERRLLAHGPNELSHEEHASPWALFFGQFRNTLVLILLAAAVLSAFLGEIVDAAIIFVIVVFCAVLGFVQEYRAERALDALKRMLASTITVVRDGVAARLPARDVVPGDILLVEAGDRIPADARIVESHALTCDEAPLTGESFPVEKDTAAVPESAPIGDRRGILFTGTTVTYGRGRAVVTATGMETEFGKIAREVASVKAEKSPLEKRTEEIGRWLGVIAMAVCAVAIVAGVGRAWVAGTLDMPLVLSMTMFAIALAVAAVPEALAAIVTGALAVGMHEMAKRNALVRRMPVVETLGCTTVICSDKTGTLTRGEMTARRLYCEGRTLEVGGAGYAPAGDFQPPLEAAPGSLRLMLAAGVLCNDASLEEDSGRWRVRGDPTEGALVVLAAKAVMAQVAIRG